MAGNGCFLLMVFSRTLLGLLPCKLALNLVIFGISNNFFIAFISLEAQLLQKDFFAESMDGLQSAK